MRSGFHVCCGDRRLAYYGRNGNRSKQFSYLHDHAPFLYILVAK
jgi:hypothetical protein